MYGRERAGKGLLVEFSLLETAIGFSSWTSAGWLVDRKGPTRQGSRHRQNAPYQRFATKDGYMMIGAGGQSTWVRCAAALGHPEWVAASRFLNSRERMKNRPALEAALVPVLADGHPTHRVPELARKRVG